MAQIAKDTPRRSVAGRDLTRFFDPRSVAVVGASDDASKWGGDLATRLVTTPSDRRVFLVNRRAATVHGHRTFASLRDVPEAPDLVIVAVPADAFEATVHDGLSIGVRNFIGVFAGLGERSAEGQERERATAESIRREGGALLGPNCMGVADTRAGFSAVAFLDIPAGQVGFISQSGAMGEEFVMRASQLGIGFSRYITVGNQTDVTMNEILAEFEGHEPTRVVALYVEDLIDARVFADTAARVIASGRPIVLLSPGRSAAGRRAALSHTGALAADAEVLDDLCAAVGVVRVETPRELFDATTGLLGDAPMCGPRVAVITEGGGHGSVAADALASAGLEVPELSPGLMRRIRQTLPSSAGANPIDFALATTEPDAYARVVPVLMQAEEIDAVLAVGQLGLASARFPHQRTAVEAEERGARAMATESRRGGKPMVVNTVYESATPARTLRSEGVPVCREIGAAAGILAARLAVSDAQRLGPYRAPAIPSAGDPVTTGTPDYFECRRIVERAGVPVIKGVRAATTEEARSVADELGYPVALKAIGLLHKSDAGGVALDLDTPEAVVAAADDMTARLSPPGFVVERMAETASAVELLMGCRRLERFGPVLLVGLGGLFAEVLRDFRTALAPVQKDDVVRLLLSLRGASLLEGLRGRPTVDLEAVGEVGAALSRYFARHPDILEMEVNPLSVREGGVLALDARIIMTAPS